MESRRGTAGAVGILQGEELRGDDDGDDGGGDDGDLG